MHLLSFSWRRGRTSRATSVLAAAALGAGTLPLVAAGSLASASAADEIVTNFGFQATAYGSQVTSPVPAFRSDKSAYSIVACTRVLNRSDRETLASLAVPSDDPLVQIDGVASSNKTYRDRGAGVEAAVTSLNTIARARLGRSDGPRLVLEQLSTRSTAWATTGGELRARNDIGSGRLQLLGLQGTPAEGSPLGDLVDALDQGIDEVLATLVANGEPIVIPGLGSVDVGFERLNVRSDVAFAGSFVLKVLLYGPDGQEGGGDDSLAGIGHARAVISRDVRSGIMFGEGYGANADVAGGIVSVGRLGEQEMPCRGTNGKVLEAPLAGLDFLSAGQLTAEGVTGRVMGKRFSTGRIQAWTEGEVASLQLGPLELRAIRGRATAEQNRRGDIVRRSIDGSSVGEIVLDGDSLGALTPETAADAPELEVPGVADIDFFVKQRTKRGLTTSAVVITLLEDTPGVSQLRLGNATVGIKRK